MGWHNFHIILFHEGNINLITQLVLQIFSNSRIKFINISEDFKIIPTNIWTGRSEMNLNYSLMCQFSYFHVWKYLSSYEIVCRIDEDVIMEQFPDISRNFSFITGAIVPETHELTNLTIQDILLELGMSQFYDHKFPFTNFYVTKPALWNRTEVQETLARFAHHKLSADCRWGDIPIIGLILKQKLDWNYVDGCDLSVRYYHASHSGEISNGTQMIGER